MARNIINMILWHPEMDINDAKLTYIHRGAPGNLKAIRGDSIERMEGGFVLLKEGTQIPFHRIIKIEINNKILWQK